MREILFRGKRRGYANWPNRDWLEGGLLPGAPNSDAWAIHHGSGELGFIDAVEPTTIGQFTGLTDKNGTKIFEGDIVSVVASGIDEEDGNAVIVWDEGTARFIIEWCSLVSDFDSFYGHECEVIGNIHDNPKLLKGESDR